MVYKYYVTVDGGYILNPETWKLRPNNDAGRNLHPFGLQRTCKSIAQEMAGLALKHNLVTFTTIDTMRELAFQWETLVSMNLNLCGYLLLTVAREEFGGRMPDSFKETMSHHCPEYMLLQIDINNFFQPGRDGEEAHDTLWSTDYVTASERYSFAKFIMQQPEFAPFLARVPKSVLELDLHHQPWNIPSEEETRTWFNLLLPFMTMFPRATPHIPSFWEHFLDAPNRLKYRFSAAAVAIKFLGSLKPSSRAHLRRILLDEDRESVAHPERHGRGLVRFCEENPVLRIERRVSIWRTLLPQQERADPNLYINEDGYIKERDSRWTTTAYTIRYKRDVSGTPKDCHIFNSYEISRIVAVWVAEALDLHSSITLMLDGGPIPEHTSEVFDAHVVPSAVWQEAFERRLPWLPLPSVHARWLEKGVEPPFRLCRKHYENLPGVIFDGFPRMIKDILDGSSPNVRLNFSSKGRNSDFIDREAELLLHEHRDLEWEALQSLCRQRYPWSIEPVLPLAADWAEIWDGDVLPKTEDDGGPYAWEEWMDPNYLYEWMEEITPWGYVHK
ncbi:hypothetical protein V8F06_012064 [Rhypophila decipiens]